MDTKCLRRTKSLMLALSAGLAVAITGTSCTTTYDHHGRPTQSVDPGVAVAGAAAAGLVGYAIANNRQKDKQRRQQFRQHHHYHGHHYHHPRHGRRHYR